MKNVFDIVKLNECCGCGACVNVCPKGALTYSTDEFGFYRPQIDVSKCVSCGLCVHVCPECNDFFVNRSSEVYAAINKNGEVLKRSASGGIFYALAESVIAEGGFVFGATLDENFQVKHVCVDKIIDLPLLQKSKYVQSFVGDSYKIALNKLKEGKKVLFSGTPCQVAAMKSFAGKWNGNLILVEIVCHGVPSQKFFKDYLDNLNKKTHGIKDYVFTYKRRILNGMNKYISFTTKKDKTFVKNWPQDSYNVFFMEAKNYQECCYSCKFANAERVADLTLCDYWNWELFHKKDFPACSTLSGICVNTKQGFLALEKIISKLDIVKSSYENLSAYNGCLIKPTLRPESRDAFLNEWLSEGYASLENKYEHSNRLRMLKSRLLMIIPEKLKLWIHGLRHGN
jgi:coenzyme F420-reducing hydrogenase beta subunit